MTTLTPTDIRPILVLTDFSDTAKAAYPHALRLARALGAPIRLLHVIDTMAYVGPDPIPVGTWQAHVVDAVEAKLEEHRRLLDHLGARIETAYRIGMPAYEIVRESHEGVSAIVLATHGYGGMKRLLLGSTTMKVIHHVDAPVLTVGPECPDRDVRRIVMPVELVEDAERTLEQAAWMASHYGASIELYHAVVPRALPVFIPGTGLEAQSYGDTPTDRRVRAARELGRLAETVRAAHPDVAVSVFVTEAYHAAEAICQRAEQLEADLLLLPAHNGRVLSRLMLGSVADAVVRRATVPVLVLKPEAQVAEVEPG